MNLFIEGLQGAGKSTLANMLTKALPDYPVYREGDYSPVELAWCSYMGEEVYRSMLDKYAQLRDQIEKNTYWEEHRAIVTYTRVMAEKREFYMDMEEYEIYNGRIDLAEFQNLILARYERYQGENGIFECSLLQNTIEDLMLYYELSEDEIVGFYRKVYEVLKAKNYKILYLDSADIRENVLLIKKERSDENGVEMWFPLMMEYLKNSPYGMHHKYHDLEDLLAHLERRQNIERRILQEVFTNHCVILEAKKYDFELLMQQLG